MGSRMNGRSESGVSVGDADLVLDCATRSQAGICVRASYGGLWETCRARSRGFRFCFQLRQTRLRLCESRSIMARETCPARAITVESEAETGALQCICSK